MRLLAVLPSSRPKACSFKCITRPPAGRLPEDTIVPRDVDRAYHASGTSQSKPPLAEPYLTPHIFVVSTTATLPITSDGACPTPAPALDRTVPLPCGTVVARSPLILLSLRLVLPYDIQNESRPQSYNLERRDKSQSRCKKCFSTYCTIYVAQKLRYGWHERCIGLHEGHTIHCREASRGWIYSRHSAHGVAGNREGMKYCSQHFTTELMCGNVP